MGCMPFTTEEEYEEEEKKRLAEKQLSLTKLKDVIPKQEISRDIKPTSNKKEGWFKRFIK